VAAENVLFSFAFRFPFLDALAIFVFDVPDMRVLLTHQCSPIRLSVCIGYK
jgi:hypothetical protein